jgi:hypothetical protein
MIKDDNLVNTTTNVTLTPSKLYLKKIVSLAGIQGESQN